MTFGVLEPTGLSDTTDVRGTALLEETTSVVRDALSKHAPGRPDLILVPTPSDDSQDPLNWSRMRKEAAFFALLFGTVLAGTAGPLVAPAFAVMAVELGRPLSQIAQLNGSLVLTIGVGAWLFSPIQTKYGARPAFLIASALAFVSMIWAGASKTSFPSLLAARVVQGLTLGPYFNNVPATINSLFFVHERGSRMAMWNVCLVGGVNIGPVISAQIIQAKGWTFAFWAQSAFAGAAFLATVAFLPETIYDRSEYDAELERRRAESDSTSTEKNSVHKEAYTTAVAVGAPSSHSSPWSAYRFCTGTKTTAPFWKLAIRPFSFAWSPVVIWAALTFSVCFNLLPLAATVYAQIFSAPPYNMSVAAIGIISGVPPLIGTVIGTLISGPMSDFAAKRMALANKGVYEPEYRLVVMILFLIFGGMGFYGWGLQTSSSWIVPAIFIALLHVGVSAATISCIGYVTDALREDAGDALAFVVLVKSVIMFGLVFMINDWYASQGPRSFFISLGSLVIATCGLVPIAYVGGKRFRWWFQNNSIRA